MSVRSGGGRKAAGGAHRSGVPGAETLSEVHRVPIASLLPADSPRVHGENSEHARLLAESGAELPPIVLHRATMRVVDGMHRVWATFLRGEREIAARFFDGSEEECFILAVDANVRHGLPLSLAERTAAAVRILRSYPQWSDRVVASVTGLSARTVGVQRQKLGGLNAAGTRIGRDGKVRPVSSAEGRRIAARLILECPEASLRTVAKQAGVSPGTVRDVRARLSRGEDILPMRLRSGNTAAVPAAAESGPLPRLVALPMQHADHAAECEDAADILRCVCRDPSLRLTDDGRMLLRMLEMHLADPQRWERIAQSVPPHQAQALAALARACAQQWQRLACQLDDATTGPAAGPARAAARWGVRAKTAR